MLRRRSRGASTHEHADRVTAGTSGDAVSVVTADNFTEATEGGFTIVDFWASWCAPCRRFSPVFHAVAGAHKGPVRFGTCDVEAYPEVAALLQITTIPTMVLFGPDGSEVGRVVGPPPRQAFEDMVEEVAQQARHLG